LATGGRGAPAAGGLLGGKGLLVGGREGKVMRTVSCPSAGLSDGGGVTAIRTVSFFGSVGSAIKRAKNVASEIARIAMVCHWLTYVLRKFTAIFSL
jgi:hypothetical protein